MGHSVSECGFQVPKTYQAPAHIWDLPRWWKSLLLMYKIFYMRSFGLSHQIKGPTTVKVAKTGSNCINCKKANFTVVGPLIWCDNPKVRMSKILYIHNNDFHHLGRPQMCAAAWYVFGTWKPHSETLCMIIRVTRKTTLWSNHILDKIQYILHIAMINIRRYVDEGILI